MKDIASTAHFRRIRRIEFAETDMAGIMHFSNFFRLMEETEHALFRALGMSIHERVDDLEIGWPRVNAQCEYARPLRFEDQVEIHLTIADLRTRSIRYQFEFRHAGGLAAKGELIAVCASLDKGKLTAIAIPARIREKFEAAMVPATSVILPDGERQ